MFKNINPSGTVAWHNLRKHFEEMEYVKMQDLFESQVDRVDKMHVSWNDFLFDFSKNKITDKTVELLLDLAREMELSTAIESMFKGDKINVTEGRAVLHTALRDFSGQPILVDGINVVDEISRVRECLKNFSDAFTDGTYKGSTGKAFTDVINIGIGGSDLGPRMVVNALESYRNDIGVHFISNVDDDHIVSLLSKLDPETTLVIVVSKTFTTQETILNAQTVKRWLVEGINSVNCAAHFVAVSSNIEQAEGFGIAKENIFPMWDYVGGRFSLWSAVGLSISLAVGYDHFERLLKGANQMDQHLRTAPLEENIPVIMAMLSIWYNNFYGYQTEALVPYCQFLEKFPAHLQQMIMESNGKNRNREGYPVNYQTGTIIWGEVGVNAQHAFFQLFHQGTKIIPVDFIGFVKPYSTQRENHDVLMSNFFGQTEALLNGKVGAKYQTASSDDRLQPYKEFGGNKPTNTFLIEQLTPENLGSLIAMYEHKVFVQGFIWNIFSFDQFGVEYGKKLACSIQSELERGEINNHDGSTQFLLEYYLSKR
ncbi:glucose-6-phosphate isomerase [Flavobacterium sp. HSC-61S13]|uniref:glucose-6-phosphate isomerase n=1 Tax=Flavobacterium sp. HSC-61S13 TaxID=2910963 RepID=UPI00209E5B57|nr:glucose-6-phosphate isomerase [Flavobacterium sp. HSC-61S13]MCP1997165.1 glucose-6-phosphate isomerase [Flavobacterium sp. HSC-61S13]